MGLVGSSSASGLTASPATVSALIHGRAVARPPHERYSVLRRIAAGGMAEVFLAQAESLQGFTKRVAIKRILPGLTRDRRFLEMFLDEARLSLRLQHSRIVQVFDIGRADDAYFIVMEYVDGIDLRTMLSWRARLGEPAPVELCLHIALEVCAALGYAHELADPETGHPLGIVHRDVTPANVLLSKQGEIKVLDFGVAKAGSQTMMTDPGMIKGKLGYLAPETAHGRSIDHRADLFAVGILLHEMLSAQRLFQGDNDYETVRLVQRAKVPRLVDRNPEVDGELDAVVRKALSADPALRYQSAADFADALAHYASSRRLKVTPRDLSQFVAQCLSDREAWTNKGLVAPDVAEELKEEVERFASIIYDPDTSELELFASGAGPPPVPPENMTREISLVDVLVEGEDTQLLPATGLMRPPRPEERLDPTQESIANFHRERRRTNWQVGLGLGLFGLIAAGIVLFA